MTRSEAIDGPLTVHLTRGPAWRVKAVERCTICSRWYGRTAGNQRYCTIRCRNVANVRKYRARRREAVEGLGPELRSIVDRSLVQHEAAYRYLAEH